ncbi:prohibitin family protein [Leptospira langatensis]|uniref:Prohibitin family protein n=1 Tax=Leptospira langatensis TaxID=2484983 RepID=A0A5F1ZYL2_9LEPT|nr:prohibitin family protein [Leptospira langatensis]TGJ98163.1 prohibitin family protein [Leptospira langatensis]TGL43077.1 prohibitin family protein [Leptospira langatensis]
MFNKSILSGIAIMIALSTTGCLTTIEPGRAGIVFAPFDNKVEKDILLAGNYQIPPTKDVIVYNLQWEPYKETIDVITRDDLRIDVVASITLRPIQSQLVSLHTEVGPQYYNHVVRQDFRTSVRNAFTNYPMIQISKNNQQIVKEIKAMMEDKLSSRHIEINNVNIDDISFSQQIMDAIQKKLTKEQELETMKFEIAIQKKDNEIARMNAQRDAEIVSIKAKAEADAIKIVNEAISSKYIQYKAYDNPQNKLIFVPVGPNGLPVTVRMNINEPIGSAKSPSKANVSGSFTNTKQNSINSDDDNN